MVDLMPTLPECVDGVVARRAEGLRTIYTLQCHDCGALEEPIPLITMKFKFLHCRHGAEPVRRCPSCKDKHVETCEELTRKPNW